jgi:uncharacterized protein YjbI with pentapeptide repeats
MPNRDHLAILKQGVEGWNHWRVTHPNRKPNLRGANLQKGYHSPADFSGANLSGSDLSGANLNHAELHDANLVDANLANARLWDAKFHSALLRGANLHGANLTGADLTAADLTAADLTVANLNSADLAGANLSGADLRIANLFGANLRGANLENAQVDCTTFANCDLREAKGLHLIKHIGPSTIGIDTIYKSKGTIPETFLRGCGVPESLITQMHSLVGVEDGIQFYSCFISYSGEDDDFARRLHGTMRDAHLRVWFAPEDMKGGDLLITQVETAIHVYDKLLIVLSEASLRSRWVMTELRKARKAERLSGKRKLFPVRLVDFGTLRSWECFDADSGADLAVEVREYFIPDFSNWRDHDQFEAAFSRLLKDLRAEERAK